MPIYEFRCRHCAAVESRLERSRKPEPGPCARCGSTPMERLISRVAVLRGEERVLEALASSDVLRAMGRGSSAELRRWVDRVEAELGPDVRDDVDRLAAQVDAAGQ